MKQVVIKKGKALADDIPAPGLSENTLLVKVAYSCISAGTEMANVNSTKKSLLTKALEQPDKLWKAVDSVVSDGIAATVEKIKESSETSYITGYSTAGVVVGVGNAIHDVSVGERVACAGAGIANHAEYIEVPRNLLVKIPDQLNMNEASTVTLGAIALQGVRRADVRLGEVVVVIGLGILGQITVQLLNAAGCRTVGIDLDERRIELARRNGMFVGLNPQKDNCLNSVKSLTDGFGADCVMITTATHSKEPLAEAFRMCRKRGKVVLVGTVGMEINREDMYPNELDFLISTSYGPGRYDSNYEGKGIDYPYGYVRWTENRNMQAYLELLASGKIHVGHIIEKIYDLEQAEQAFAEFNKENKPLIVLLKYSDTVAEKKPSKVTLNPVNCETKRIKTAIIGAGSFAKGIHLPNLAKLNEQYQIYAIMSRTGFNAKETARKYGAYYATTDYDEILKDKLVDLVIICTRHDLHASMAMKALNAGKAVFVEKPMAVHEKELEELVKVIEVTQRPFMVGFNRRFSKYAVEAKRQISQRVNPLFIHYRMNAGYFPPDHWVHESGGRIVGEACHIVDLMNYFIGSQIASVSFENITPRTINLFSHDNKTIILKYEDGSIATIEYFATGSKDYPKEYCEIHWDQKTIVIDDYKTMKGYGVKIPEISSRAADKGHYEEFIALHNYLNNGNPPTEMWDLIQTTQVCLAIQ
jgi:predicted dehydrogenase/threonine dehydrogenase-like Zn-dependent dehydrogenase